MSEEPKNNQAEVHRERSAIRLAGQKPPLSSYRSYWPLALAVTLCIVLLGIIVNMIILGIGIVLAIVVVIAWSLERR